MGGFCAPDRRHVENRPWQRVGNGAIFIHVYAEGLVTISHLDILHDHRAAEENVADLTMRWFFHEDGEFVRKAATEESKNRKPSPPTKPTRRS
jgi:hypothetical protein